MTEIRCPVAGCAWSTSTDLPDSVTDGALAEIFGWGVFRATHAGLKRQQAEADTRTHLESHDVLDFAKTIRGLQDLVASQVTTIVELTGQQVST